jgi:hypothetical protein
MYWTIKTFVIITALTVLSISHYFIYNKGQDSVQALWTKDKLVKAEAEIKANEQYLIKIQQLQIENQKVDKQYAQEKRKATVAATGAQLELGRLRDQLASAADKDVDSSSATAGTNGGARLEQELFGNCATTLVAMAAEADRLETVVVGLQSYVKNICLAK